MSESQLKNTIEAALLAAGRPLAMVRSRSSLTMRVDPRRRGYAWALAQLPSDYDGRGIELKETATGFRIQVRTGLAPQLARLFPERPQRYSRALLETLALIAYRQPITRAEIESVRGVAVNPNILKTLIERNWIRVVGHRDVPGHPELLGTTREFLDYFGLKSLDQLPPLAELKAMADLRPQLELPGTEPSRADAYGPDAEGAYPGAEALPTPPLPVNIGIADLGEDDPADEDELSANPESAAGLVAAPAPHRD